MSEIPGVPDSVVRAVRSIPLPRQADDDNADRAWACGYLSAVLGREVRGGRHVDELVAKLRQAAS